MRETIWICGACGKRSNDRSGNKPIDRGWDESCFTWANLCWLDSLKFEDGKVRPTYAECCPEDMREAKWKAECDAAT